MITEEEAARANSEALVVVVISSATLADCSFKEGSLGSKAVAFEEGSFKGLMAGAFKEGSSAMKMAAVSMA